MHPILFSFHGISIYSYGAAMASAFLVSILLAVYKARSCGIAPYHILDLGLYIIVSGIIGARLLYVGLNWSYYLKHPLEIILLQKGGLAFQGGLILALAAGIFLIKKRNLPLGKVVDIVIIYLPLGHAIGRIGCFLNGCCYGKITTVPWAVQFPAHSFASQAFGPGHFVHPTEIYSSLMNLGIFLILVFTKKQFDGELFFDYMILYGIGRFFIEIFRVNPVIFWGLTAFQLICIAMIITGVLLKMIISRRICQKSVTI